MSKRESREELEIRIKELEEEASQRKQELKQLRMRALILDQIEESVTITDLDGKIVYVNEAHERTLGRSRDELLGETTQAYGDSSERRATQEEILRETLSRGHWQGEVVNYTSDGDERIMSGRTWTVRGEEGEPVALAGAFTDITRLNRTQQALLRSESKSTDLFNLMEQGAFYKGSDGVPVDVNPAHLKMFGVSREQFFAAEPFDPGYRLVNEDLKPLDDTDLPSSIAAKTGRTIRGEVIGVVHPDREGYTWVSISAIPQFRKGDRKPHAVFVTAHDITEFRRLEESLRDLNANLSHKVAERTSELEEMNVALDALLRKAEREKEALGANVVSNVRTLIEPYVDKLERSCLDQRQTALLGILRMNLTSIISAFSSTLSGAGRNLTPSELRIADLIAYGKTSKEVSELLTISLDTVSFHRKNIRKKLGLQNKASNLQLELRSLL